ncbi:hypothetical protein B0H11DRAFT_1819876 [Mycena galericulata]|nr:hypothetical protein B0H11DRAFT_1819876 [Mycena galericulata]
MAVSLPDEIISEIVTPALRVSDQRFSDTSTTTSPFATYEESTSAILLVCKAWLRVSTPLLYHVVVLRSKAQAKALDATLKKNPDLGRFVKKLRVEGGFGLYMHGILKSAPNITDIYLSLHIHASDSPSGLVSGLSLINPQRLILWDEEEKRLKNRHVSQLMASLEALAKKWDNMKTVVFPYTYGDDRHDFIMAISRGSGVITVSFPVLHVSYLFPGHIHDVAQNESITTIEIRTPTTPSKAETYVNRDAENSKLIPRLRFFDTRTSIPNRVPPPGRPVLRPLNPSFKPMELAPQATVDRVWDRVLFFAMNVTDHRPMSPYHYSFYLLRRQRRSINAERLRYLLVSKTFHRLALQYLYRWPDLTSTEALQRFQRKLAEDPSLGLHMRELLCPTLYSPNPTEEIQTIIFAHTPHLTRLGMERSIQMDWRVFCALAETAGASLVELSVNIVSQRDTPDVPDPAVLSRFTALRSFAWSCSSDVEIPPSESASAGFPSLEFLDVNSSELYPLLTSMNLPSIRRVNLTTYGENSPYVFLARHGSKIRELAMFRPAFDKLMALCPNLLDVEVRLGNDYGEPNPLKAFVQTLGFPQKHHALAKVSLDKCPQERKVDEDAEWDLVFSAFEPLHFPALRELQIMQCEWPAANERAIAQSVWVKRAERLFKHGIKVTNKDAIHWRPRLKSSRR